MGLFSGGLGAALGGAIAGPVGMVAGGLLGNKAGTSGIKNALFGKKDTGVDDRFIELDPEIKAAQEQARGIRSGSLTGLSRLGQENTQDLIRQAQQGQRGAYEDSRRSMQSAIASRGLGKSSVGLSQLAGLESDFRNRQANIASQINAGALDRARQRELQNIQAANAALGTPGLQRTFIQGREGTGQRSGGLFGLATTLGGAGLGAMYGGPQGAAIGANLGGTLGSTLPNIF